MEKVESTESGEAADVEEHKEAEVKEEGLLLPLESLLATGIQIGTRVKTTDMEPYVYRVRPDGLFILDVSKINEKIKTAAVFLAQFNPKEVVVVSARLYGKTPVQKFCEVAGTTPLIGRFMPGLFTNPLLPTYMEPKVVVVTDPKADEQAVIEASAIGIPVVALCDTDNIISKVDLVIPANNKGRKALASVFWLLARQLLRERKEITADGEIAAKIDDFETKVEGEVETSTLT